MTHDAEVEEVIAAYERRLQVYRDAQAHHNEERARLEAAEAKSGVLHMPRSILPFLYLGDRGAARNSAALAVDHIGYVLNMSATPTPADVEHRFAEAKIKYLRLPAEDVESDPIFEQFDKAIEFIEEARVACERGDTRPNVMIYSSEGVSRSATIILAYLIKRGWSLRGACSYVKRLRPSLAPNKGFFEQLIDFEKQTHNGRQTCTAEDYSGLFF